MLWPAFSLLSPPLSESGDAANPTVMPRQGGRVSILIASSELARMSSDTKTKWSLVMKVFTTGQVAKICKVAPRTVSKWFDSGRLKGYRIPGSQDRRIPREYLIKFLKEHGMPLGDLEDEAMAKVLLVGQDQVYRLKVFIQTALSLIMQSAESTLSKSVRIFVGMLSTPKQLLLLCCPTMDRR
jgi:excisionase family DNA binding protein